MTLTTKPIRCRWTAALICLFLAMTTLPVRAGVAVDGNATIYWGDGLVYARAAAWYANRDELLLSINPDSVSTGGGILSHSGFKEWQTNAPFGGSNYLHENTGDALITTEVRVGNGSASLDMFAEVTTSATLSSSDHWGGSSPSNTTYGFVSTNLYFAIGFTSPVSYSVSILNPVFPYAGDRYVERIGEFDSVHNFLQIDATAIVKAVLSVRTFNETVTKTSTAHTRVIFLYGLGAVQFDPILPFDPVPPTSPEATAVSNTTATFTAVNGGRWYASGLSQNFLYEALGETVFTEIINLPNGFSGTVSIWSEGTLLGEYQAGDFFSFEDILGHSVTSFSVRGIVPEAGVDTFPIQLGFDSETGSFQQSELLVTSPGVGRSDQLLLGKSGAGDLQLDWLPSCSTDDDDYAIYAGDMGDFIGHTLKSCSTSGATTATITPFGGDRYYLVVPLEGASEGSYGRDSAGLERPVGLATCGTQDIASPCP